MTYITIICHNSMQLGRFDKAQHFAVGTYCISNSALFRCDLNIFIQNELRKEYNAGSFLIYTFNLFYQTRKNSALSCVCRQSWFGGKMGGGEGPVFRPKSGF
jgi:hypothetical protein